MSNTNNSAVRRDKRCESIRLSRVKEATYTGEFYEETDVRDFCIHIDSKYLKSGGYRTLIKEDKKMFFSILKFSSPINECSNITFRSRVCFLQGNVREYRCPECGKEYSWDNTKFVFKMKRCDVHFKNKWDLSYYTRYYGDEKGRKLYEEYLARRRDGTEKTKAMKVNSKQFFIKKFGDIEGERKYIESVNNRLSKSNKCYSVKSQVFFEQLVTECRLDKEKCFYATNNGEKTFRLNAQYAEALGQELVRVDFAIGSKIIEYNGVYWHRNTAERDFTKKCFLEDSGFEVLVVWENEDNCNALKRAKHFINQGRYLIKTRSGYSEFKGVRKIAAEGVLRISYNGTHIDVSEDHRFMVFSREVRASALKVGDILQTESGAAIITDITRMEGGRDVYDVLETTDHTYITNGIVSHNCEFLGSTLTLISSDSIKRFKPKEPVMILANKLRVFEEPKPGHKYIMGVDPAKFGSDSFSIQVIDVTTFPFIEAAAAKLPDENFQKMPAYIYEWAKWYNEAFLIIENNDGAGTYANTVLHTDYEYENLYFEKTFNTYKNESKTKVEPGFRTNVKNRALILDAMKLLIDNQKLVIYDINTIKEFNTFVLKNNKFQADDGFHDDMIMALCIALAPFADAKNFDNIKELTDKMYSSDSSETDFTDFLCIGSFDDGSSGTDDTLSYFGDEPDTGGELTLEEKREILREIDANRKLR